MNEIKLLLADDHQIVLDGLKMVLSSQQTMDVVDTASNGIEVLSILKKQRIDVVILDINMPEMDGIRCAKTIKKEYPKVKVIILTMYAQKSFVEEIIRIGIDGCLLKNNTGQELIHAVERVHSGRSYYDQIQNFTQENGKSDDHPLSERELQVIHKLAEGLTSPQIADELFISEHTVRTHRKNILKKLQLHNSSELIQYAINNGII